MTISLKNLCILLVACSSASQISAYKVQPKLLTTSTLKTWQSGWFEKMSPVHETLTGYSLACAQEVPAGNRPPTTEDVKNHITDPDDPLIRGSRWPDDPNNLFEAGHYAKWCELLFDAEKLNREGSLTRTHRLTYRSHYLDLQFLHAMASKGQAPQTTQKNILEWCHFAYAVAVGEIKETEVLWTLKDRYPFVLQLFGTGPAMWTVRRLFTDIGQGLYQKDGKDEMLGLDKLSSREFRHRVAGALLHTIQDSYSNSHTERDNPGDENHPPSGAIRAFLDYGSQNSKFHSKADLDPRWPYLNEGLQDGPILHGAWILRRVLAERPWDPEVETYFRERVFPLSPKARPADGGACAG